MVEINDIPIITLLYQLYATFHNSLKNFPRVERYSLGADCQKSILAALRYSLLAASTNAKLSGKKSDYLRQASAELDILKLLLKLARDCHCYPNQTYQQLDSMTQKAGKMLGGWLKSIPNSP